MADSAVTSGVYIINPPEDIYEQDDSDVAAGTIANGETQNRSIDAAGDPDWVRFTVGVDGATNVQIATDGGIGGDTEMWLYGPNSPTRWWSMTMTMATGTTR